MTLADVLALPVASWRSGRSNSTARGMRNRIDPRSTGAAIATRPSRSRTLRRRQSGKPSPGAIQNIPRQIPIEVDVGFRARDGSDLGLDLDVPAFASGGIVRKPTLALIGEAGPEAVVPLTGGGGFTPQTEQHIHLYQDGRQTAHSVIRNLDVARIYVR